MPDLLEPPPQTDTDALKASFNTAVAAQDTINPKAVAEEVIIEGDKPTLVPVKAKEPPLEKAKEESIVPDQFTKKPEEKAAPVEEEIPINAGTKQLRDVLARRDAKLKEVQAHAEELRLKLEKAPVAGPSKEHEERIRLATERAEKLEAELERAAYNRSPKFQKFESEHTAELASAKSYLEGTEISATILDVAANQTGQARLKTLRDAGMDAETIAAVGPHLARADAIRRERDASLDNWKQNQTAEQEHAKSQQARQEQERQAQDQIVLKEVATRKMKDNPAFTKVDGHEKWNAMVDRNLKDAEDFAMGRKQLSELFEIGYDGIGARTQKIMYDEVKKEVVSLREEVGRLRAAQPGTGKSVDVKAGDATRPMDETSEHKNAFNAALANLPGRP